MNARTRFAAVVVAAAIPLTALSGGVASATGYHPPNETIGHEGCTPGYWKNHYSAWAGTGYSPSTRLGNVFNTSSAFDNYTFGQALSFNGGPGVAGATRILMRAAVAALLNAKHTGVDYALRSGAIINQVNQALASNNRSTILDLATKLDRKNNAGCPL